MLKKFGLSILFLAAPVIGLQAAQASSSCDQVQTAISKLKLAIKEAAALVQMDASLNTPDLQAALNSMNQAIVQDTVLLQTLNCGSPASAAPPPLPVRPNLPPVCAQAMTEVREINAYRAGLSVVLKNPPQGSTAADLQHNENAKTQAMAKLKAEMQTLTDNGCK
jgi:hypothetical protein